MQMHLHGNVWALVRLQKDSRHGGSYITSSPFYARQSISQCRNLLHGVSPYVWEWPSLQTKRQLVRSKVVLHTLEFFDIPIRPDELSAQKLGFRQSCPNTESR